MQKPIPIILDTDIGDDIDDALALALILNSPEIDLRAVTTVFGKTQQAATLVQKVLLAWNRADIPVFAGCSEPLLQKPPTLNKRQFQVLSEVEKSTFGHALDYLAHLPARVPGDEKITIVAIGPLTNIALALARQPLLAKDARLVMMGGQGLTLNHAVWNIRWDPEAAAMVLNSGIEIHQITNDVTTQVQLSQAHLDAVRSAAKHNKKLQLLCQLIDLWQEERRATNGPLLPQLHDPLAALTLFTNCVTFQNAHATVQLCDKERGVIAYSTQTAEPTNFHVSTQADANKAIDIFMKRLLRE